MRLIIFVAGIAEFLGDVPDKRGELLQAFGECADDLIAEVWKVRVCPGGLIRLPLRRGLPGAREHKDDSTL